MSYRTRNRNRALLGLLVLIGGLVAVWVVGAWWLMLGVGIAHRDWWPLMPTMSYHAALILWLFFGGVAGIVTGASRAKS
jgi:hypothetical protein